MLVRKKCINVLAWPVRDLMNSVRYDWAGSLPTPIAAQYDLGNVIFATDHIEIKTLEGWVSGGMDDMVIQGIEGELYPCKKSVFEKTYEIVSQ
jgi:hypothetical protein